MNAKLRQRWGGEKKNLEPKGKMISFGSTGSKGGGKQSVINQFFEEN